MGVFSQLIAADDHAETQISIAKERARLRQAKPTGHQVRDPWQSAPFLALATGSESDGSAFQPVRGVSLELFAGIAKTVAARDDDHAHGTELAQACGIAPRDWLFASRIWNTRIARFPAVGRQLSELYRDDERSWLAPWRD
jgi:hypothetical protein